jgi:D-hydroxyproline dehydrogenase subunit gamma
MLEQVTISVNGVSTTVPRGTTVAAAVMLAAQPCRNSVSGQPRGPLCGMGICFECRVNINTRLHCRSCQIICEQGMEVTTDE